MRDTTFCTPASCFFFVLWFYHKSKNREGPGMRIARKESPRNEDWKQASFSLYHAAPTSPPVPLNITITPNSPNPYPLTLGAPLVLRCQATGGGSVAPTLSWLKDSKAVSQGVMQDSSGLLLSVLSVQVHKASEHNAPSMLCPPFSPTPHFQIGL